MLHIGLLASLTLQGSLCDITKAKWPKNVNEKAPPPLEEQTFILNGKSTVVPYPWWFVRSFVVVVVFYVPTYLQYSTVQFCCTCAVNKTPGGPRAQEGTRTTGNTRALTHGHLKAVHWGAKNTHLRLRSKHIAPKPRIARAPELVSTNSSYFYHTYTRKTKKHFPR
jgi:hypothetical protein